MDDIGAVVGAIIGILILVVLLGGAIKTFQRNWVAALFLLIFLTPIWAIWAFIEVFTGDINKTDPAPVSNNQSVNVTLINQADGTARQLTDINPNDYPDLIEAQVVDTGASLTEMQGNMLDTDVKECPFCAETVKRKATVCRFCNRDI